MNNYGYLGVVRGGRFESLVTEDESAGPFRLTTKPSGDAAPEAGEISLKPHEGRALLVRGIADAGWIRAATIIEEAGLIVTAVAVATINRAASLEIRRLLFLS